jgi:hypothetical protein
MRLVVTLVLLASLGACRKAEPPASAPAAQAAAPSPSNAPAPQPKPADPAAERELVRRAYLALRCELLGQVAPTAADALYAKLGFRDAADFGDRFAALAKADPAFADGLVRAAITSGCSAR